MSLIDRLRNLCRRNTKSKDDKRELQRFELGMARWERFKGTLAILGLVGLLASSALLILQFSTRSLFAQVDAVTQVIDFSVSSGKPLYWALPADFTVAGCGFDSQKTQQTSDEEGSLLLRPGATVHVERTPRHIYVFVRERAGTPVDSRGDGEAAGVFVDLQGKSLNALKPGDCVKIPVPGDGGNFTWHLRGDLVVGDELAEAPQQKLLLEGEVQLFQALGSSLPAFLSGSQFLSESRKLNLGEKIVFQLQKDNLTVPAELSGVLRVEEGDKAGRGFVVSAFGEVSSIVAKRPLRNDKTADYEIKGDFPKMLFGLLRDGTQSFILLAIAICWFLVTKHWFKS